MDLSRTFDLLLAALVLAGAGFALVGAIGLVRLGDFMQRMHGPTKTTTLGTGCVLLASALWFSAALPAAGLAELLVLVFLFATAPVAAHLLAQAAMQGDPRLRPPQPGPDDDGRAD